MADKRKVKKSLPSDSVRITVSDYGMMEDVTEKISLISRFIIALVAVIGICFFVLECLGEDYSVIETLLLPTLFTVAFFVAFSSFKLFLIGSASALGLVLALAIIKHTTVIKLILGGAVHIYNRLMLVIDSLGFIPNPEIATGIDNPEGSITVIALISAFITCLCIRKRALFLLYTVAVCFVLCPAYYYGMADGLFVSAAIICAICGFAAVRFSEKQGKDRNSAGITGVISLILAASIMLTTLIGINEPWKEWKPFTPYAQIIARIFDDLSAGRPITLGWGTTIPDPSETRSARTSPRLYLGQKVMTVYSNTSSPLYIRTWAGGDYQNDTWLPVSVGGKSLEISREAPYSPLRDMVVAYAAVGVDVLTAIGMRRTSLNIVLENSSPVMPLPLIADNMYNADGYSLANRADVDGVFDIGEYEGRYSADIVSRYWVNDETSAEMSELIEGYIQFLGITTGEISKGAERNRYAQLLIDRNNSSGMRDIIKRYGKYRDYVSSSYSYDTSDDAVSRVIIELFEKTDIEKYFLVEENLTYAEIPVKMSREGYVGDGSVYLYDDEGRVNRYYLGADGVANAEGIGKTVALFLGERCGYSLNPRRSIESAMEEFLYGSKQGYCVQFATAGALIMRELGFVSRYAEGYVASHFVKNKSQSINGTFRSDILDKNAHAWTEVWVDGYGWMQLEMTPSYYELFNPTSDVTDTTAPPKTDPPSVTTPEPTTSETDAPTETVTTAPVTDTESSTQGSVRPPETTQLTTTDRAAGGGGGLPKSVITSLAIIIPATLLFALTVYAVKSVSDKRKRRRKRLDGAVYGAENAPEAERVAIGRTLTAELSAVLSAYGYSPLDGELPRGFGARLDGDLERLGLPALPSEALEAVVKQVYGGGMSGKELITVHTVTNGLRKAARKELGIPRYLINKIKGIL